MTVSGPDLGAELYWLWRGGMVTLPSLAAVYAQATQHVHNTSWRQKETFDDGRTGIEWDPRREQLPGGEGIGPHGDWTGYDVDVTQGLDLGYVYPNWTELRDTLQNYLAKTAEMLSGSGLALVAIADAYASVDQCAADELVRMREERDPLSDVPEVPEVRRPGDGYDTTVIVGTTGSFEVLEEETVDPLGG